MLLSMISVTPADFVKILNGVAIGFAAILLLAFITGLFRKFWRNTLNLLVFLGLLILIYFLINPLLNSFLNLHPGALPFGLGGLIPASFDVTISGSQVSVSTLTVNTMLTDLIKGVYTANGVSVASSPGFNDYAYQLVLVVGRYMLYLLLVICAIILTPIIMLVVRLFGLIFHRKKKKIRVLGRVFGALFNTVRIAVVGLAILLPFTSMTNTVALAFSDPDNVNGSGSSQLYTDIEDMSQAYEDSTLYKILFGWSANAEGETFDTTVMNMIAGGTYNGQAVTLTSELSSVAGAAKTLLSSGLIGGSSVDLTALMDTDTVNSLFNNLGDSQLLVNYMPLYLHKFFASTDNNFVVPAYKNDFADALLTYNYDDELNNIRQMLITLIDGGIASSIINVYSSSASTDLSTFYTPLLGSSAITPMDDIFTLMGTSPFVSAFVSNVFYSMMSLSSTSGSSGSLMTSLMPSNYPDFTAVDWSSELRILYRGMANMYQLSPSAVGLLAGTASTSWQDFVLANETGFRNLLGGSYDGAGNPINYDATTGLSTDSAVVPLFDSDLVMNNSDSFMSSIFSSFVNSSPVAASYFNAEIASWDSSDIGLKRINYKTHIGELIEYISTYTAP